MAVKSYLYKTRSLSGLWTRNLFFVKGEGLLQKIREIMGFPVTVSVGGALPGLYSQRPRCLQAAPLTLNVWEMQLIKTNQQMTYYIGCSGYYYKEWKEIFYPAGLTAKDWFKFYCQHFNTLEINSSFYRTPAPASLQRWYQESPARFLFSVKAPRIFTHLKQFRVDKEEIRAFYDLVSAGLKEKLGCILFQMPPSFSFTPERLQSICEQLDPTRNNVVEFRHESWWRREVFDTLQRHNITFCGQSYPGNLPDSAVVNNKIIYYRFHGKPVLYRSTYKEEDLQLVLNEMGKGQHHIFIYFNNTWKGSAIINGKQMQELTGTKK